MVTTDSAEILRRLGDAGVELIVVGMAAGILQGVPTTTRDLDIVHQRTPENVERLLRVLRDIDAVARHDPRRIQPNAGHLLGPEHVLTEKRFGDLDCLGAVNGERTYEDLLAATVLLDFEGHPLRVLELRELIAIKRRACRPKDLAVIPTSSRPLTRSRSGGADTSPRHEKPAVDVRN
jgi:hypothetical protein